MFTYIVTIHNSQELLPRTLAGIGEACTPTSEIVAILDGCSDNSENVVDSFTAQSGLNVRKVRTDDVHELRSLNAGLAQIREGYAVCVQDDVVLQQRDLEHLVTDLYDRVGPSLGVVSFRHAMNVRRLGVVRQLRRSGLKPLVVECDRVIRPEEATSQMKAVPYGQLVFRMVAGGSPFVIPQTVRTAINAFEDEMAPYMWFDHEYSLRAAAAGFHNGVYPVRFVSELQWGGSRKVPMSPKKRAEFDAVVLRNRRFIWRRHGRFIRAHFKEYHRENHTAIGV